ncbi:MAG: hypothetical protein JRI87_12655 [Deltaproteobacteria bacterium]|nr:hypothetical protein [Deltaproteobacteria bacterium]
MVSFLQVIGGLTLFLFGVRMLSKGMEKIAGSKIQDWLERMTSGRLKAALFGTGVTAVMQSSHAEQQPDDGYHDRIDQCPNYDLGTSHRYDDGG